MSDRAYKVEPTTGACSHCKSDQAPYFDVVGPDGFAQGTQFAEEVDAEEHANALNGAFEKGQELLVALLDHVRRLTEMIHTAHHGTLGRPWLTCPVITCIKAREAITQAGGQL